MMLVTTPHPLLSHITQSSSAGTLSLHPTENGDKNVDVKERMTMTMKKMGRGEGGWKERT
jgi:hypothetical protein